MKVFKNKDQFVKLLYNSLEADDHQVVQSEGDMDIVSETLKGATEGNEVTIIANDKHLCSFTFPQYP